jgi:hypothetical protein
VLCVVIVFAVVIPDVVCEAQLKAVVVIIDGCSPFNAFCNPVVLAIVKSPSPIVFCFVTNCVVVA